MKKINVLTSLSASVVLMTGFVPILVGCGNKQEDTGIYHNDKVHSDLPIASDIQKVIDNIDWHNGYSVAKELAYNSTYFQHLGWRLAGSQAEHDTAWLIEQWFKMWGLDVVTTPVACDSFDFNNSRLLIADPETNDIWYAGLPASYQISAPEFKNGKEIVIRDCGTGTLADWPSDFANGEVALVGIDQWNDIWIDSQIRFAKDKGASALITYARSGYGDWDKYQNNTQDVCAGGDNVIPTVSIALDDAQFIQSKMKNGRIEGKLTIDVELNEHTGTSNIVSGIIRGSLPQEQRKQIVIGGHYDKYWHGFQDDSLAVGAMFAIMFAMKKVGWQPKNDIVFSATGAEEWARTDSQFDWAGGSWGLLEQDKTWADKTIFALNSELPALYSDAAHKQSAQIGTTPELKQFTSEFIKSGLCVTTDVGILTEPAYERNREDGISYRAHGTPTFICASSADDWFPTHYHTTSDDPLTFNPDMYVTNLNWMTALLMYIDSCAALPINISGFVNDVKTRLNEPALLDAGISQSTIEQYLSLLNDIDARAQELNTQIYQTNADYFEAVKKEDTAAQRELFSQGQKLTKKVRDTYKEINCINESLDTSLLSINDNNALYGHVLLTNNIDCLNGMLQAIENKQIRADDESGVLDLASSLNDGHEYVFTMFDEKTGITYNSMFNNQKLDKYKTMWGYKRQLASVELLDETEQHDALGAQIIKFAQTKESDLKDADWKAFKDVVNLAKQQVKAQLDNRIEQEIALLKIVKQTINK